MIWHHMAMLHCIVSEHYLSTSKGRKMKNDIVITWHYITWHYIMSHGITSGQVTLWGSNTPCNILYSITTFLAPRGRRTRTKKEKKLPSPSPSNPEVLGDPVLPSPGTHSGAMLTSILWEHRGPLRGLVLLWQDHVTKQQEIHFYGKDKNVVWAIINLGKRNLNHVTSSPLFSPTFVLASFPGQAGRGLGTRLYLSHNVRFSW